MSQTTLLEKVSLWSPETCVQELKSVLPKLVSMQQSTNSWDEHIRILKVITEMFLPHLSVSQLEEECFSHIFPKVVQMFNGLLEEISSQVGGLSSQNPELCSCVRKLLQTLIQQLEVLSFCIRHVCSFGETPPLDAFWSLPSCVLKVLKETFTHCKESETVYSGRLSLVADLLQALFKEGYSLQKGLMELLERVAVGRSISEAEISDIVTVVHSLLDICSIISNLDIVLHANTWKFIIKQSVKYQSQLEEQLHHGDIVSCLCDDLLTSLQSCCELAQQMRRSGLQDNIQCPESKLFQKRTKMCRFFANTLVHYIKEFKPYLAKSCGCFHHLHLQIFSKFPPSLWRTLMSSTHYKELNSGVLVAMDPLVAQLVSFRPFAEAVLAEKQYLTPELLFPHCLLLVNIVSKLRSQPDDVLRLWCEGSQFPEEMPRLSIFRALFESFRSCWSERAEPVLVPGLMINGQAQSQVTLHHHVCIQLSALVAVLPAAMFPVLERSLLEAVMQSDTQTALLATDIWCFLARYGTAELCMHHVVLTAHLIKMSHRECYQARHLGMLLRRMMFLMTSQHQMQIVEKFSPREAENLPVWSHVLIRALSEGARKRVQEDIVTLVETSVTSWLEKGRKLGELKKVNTALSALLVVVRDEASESKYWLSALKLITQLWPYVCVQQVQRYPSVKQTLRLLFIICAVLVRNLNSDSVSQTLDYVKTLMSQRCPDDLLLAALDFLASTGQYIIPAEDQNQLKAKLCSLFSALLQEESWPLHQHALEAFSLFAEVTSHEEVISQSLTSEKLKNEVVNFLSKVPNMQETEEARNERLKSVRQVFETHDNSLKTDKEEPAAELQPRSKRPRQEAVEEEELEKYLQTTESTLKALQALAERTPLPPWASGRLHDLQALIAQINSIRPPKT